MDRFSLRLSDNEAAALDIMAYCFGVSKNKLLQLLIDEAFDNFLIFGNPPAESDILAFDFPTVQSLPDRLIENLEHLENTTSFELKRIINTVDYALDKYDADGKTPTEAQRLEKLRENLIEALRNA